MPEKCLMLLFALTDTSVRQRPQEAPALAIVGLVINGGRTEAAASLCFKNESSSKLWQIHTAC